MTQNSRIHLAKLRFLILVLLVLGVFFRFVNLDRKVYWNDETYTSLRIAGYTAVEMVQQVCDGREITIKDLHKYQRLNSDKDFIDTVKALAVEEPQHPPLYYIMARLWVQWLGNSIAVIRSLSAFTSLLVFPCLYWLCVELFESLLVGGVAIALMAVSPFHVLYAQEAREYCLWTVMILLSSASLLWAIRLKTKLSWGVYATTVMLGLYTFPLTALVVIGHGAYVLLTERFRLSKTVTAYLIASIVGFIAFVPWILVIVTDPSRVQVTTIGKAKEFDLLYLGKAWIVDLSRVFFDLGLHIGSGSALQLLSFAISTLLIVVLIAYSIYFLYRQTSKRIWLFILTLIGIPVIALLLPDLISGTKGSTTSRYLIPCYLGVQLAVAYLFTTKITSISINSWRQKLWQLIMLILLSGGVLSCVISSQAEAWWNKIPGYYNHQVARVVNQAPQPLVISDSCQFPLPLIDVLSLSYQLDPKVRLQLVVEPSMLKLSDSFSNAFLFKPSQVLRNELEKKQDYDVELVYEPGDLWRLEKRNS